MTSAGVMYTCIALSAVATILGVGLFARAVAQIYRVARSGAPETGRWDHPWRRIWTAVRLSLSHETFKNRPLVRVAHWLVMVSFVVLIGTLISAYGQLFNPQFALPIIGASPVWNAVVEVLALAGFVAIVALYVVRMAAAAGAKTSGRPRFSRFYGSTRWQAWFVEAVIAAVCAAVLLNHALLYAYATVKGWGTYSWGRLPLHWQMRSQ